MATLDAIICREWQYRYYSFDNSWDQKTGDECFLMRNGSGDEFQTLFSKHGAIINGFAHESEMSQWHETKIKPVTLKEKFKSFFGQKKTAFTQKIWEGVVDTVPDVFRSFLFTEPIRSIGTTFCTWRKTNDSQWHIGNFRYPGDDYGDGSADLLNILDNNPTTYKNWAVEYYEEQFEAHNLRIDLVKHIYDFKPLTKAVITGINPELTEFEDLKSDLNGIGYPHIDL
ncbi:hypothetical protein [Flavihumibacter petaseus]|uniref:Uncharacterized protein n=1 Tax=Flavihumibacter petaseus NBRC 106054 TaxID=1220578 RepID=A0A0E9MUX8_9BACT|nr:hypothetical protein [Flavihumibacter petaseus]GAO41364.1 hypothetical protein FPE01S_01_03760 [Flavihumibacter petaseus NBRC 106054]